MTMEPYLYSMDPDFPELTVSTTTGCQTKLDNTCKENLKLVLDLKLVAVLYHLQLAKQLEVIG